MDRVESNPIIHDDYQDFERWLRDEPRIGVNENTIRSYVRHLKTQVSGFRMMENRFITYITRIRAAW